MNDGDHRLIQIPAGIVEADVIKLSGHLLSQTEIAQNDEGNEGAKQAEDVRPHDDLLYGTALADASHEERGGHAPYHPVCPVEDGPVLWEAVLPQRIRVGG